MREFFSNRNYFPIFYAFGGYLVLTVGAFLIVQSNQTFIGLVQLLSPLSVLAALVAAIWIRYSTHQTDNEPTIWNRIVLGLVFWTIAETIWLNYYLRGQGSGPFPNAADFFWLAGYVPFIEAMTLRYLNSRSKTGKSRFISITFFLLALIIPITYILTAPTVLLWQDWERTAILWTQTGYVLANLSLLPFAILLLITTGRGKLFQVWGLISIAFILHSLMYFAMNYLMDEIQLTGRYVTIPIVLGSVSHLILGAGIYGNWLIGKQIALVSQLKLGFIGQEKEIPLFLINTDVEGKILNISHNFLQFTNNSLPERYLGKPIQDALNLTAKEFAEISSTCARGGFIINHDIRVAAGQKAPVPLLLTATGALTAHDFFGLDIALQLPYYSAHAYPLDPESNAIVQEILRRTGQQTQESSAQLADYFIAHIRSFYQMIAGSTGNHTVASMTSEINTTATKNNWPIRVNGQEVTIEPGFSNFDNAELLKALPILFHIAREYTVKATSSRAVDEQTEKTNLELNKRTLQTAKYFGLR